MPLRDLVTAEVMRTIAGIFNHLNIEEREGVEFPYIEKTARPSAQQPWTIVIPPAGTVALSDAVPLSDGYGSAGSSPLAARATHVHPLNVPQVPDSVVNPPDVDFFSQDMGYSPLYARADHGHSLSENVIDAIDEVLDSLVDDLDLVFEEIGDDLYTLFGQYDTMYEWSWEFADAVNDEFDSLYEWSWDFADYYAEWSQDLDDRIVEWSGDFADAVNKKFKDIWDTIDLIDTDIDTLFSNDGIANTNFNILFDAVNALLNNWRGGMFG